MMVTDAMIDVNDETEILRPTNIPIARAEGWVRVWLLDIEMHH